MPRELSLGNGRLLINFDGRFNMRDLYYPYVGWPNHISHLGGEKSRLGLWTDGRFAWLEESSWELQVGYKPGTLNGRVRGVNKDLKVALEIENGVHYRWDVFLQKVTVHNLAASSREIRLFFYHDFTLNESPLGDTAAYLPDRGVLLHYKRGLYFLINGRAGGEGFFQYATGNKRFRGAEGTWRDAEDGHLEGNPIHHGSVDSTASFRLYLAPGEKGKVYYWIAAGRNWSEVARANGVVLASRLERILAENGDYWRAWARKYERDFGDLPPAVVDLYYQSLLVIRTQTDGGGAILAASDSDILYEARDHYGYCWPRDGALVAAAMDQAGYPEVSFPFYYYCSRILDPRGFFYQKYNPDGTLGSSWLPPVHGKKSIIPFQEDETALVLWALGESWNKYRDWRLINDLYPTLVRPAAEFLLSYRDTRTGLPLPSYDLWEERRGVFTFTAAAVYAGLKAAGLLAHYAGRPEEREKYWGAAEEVKRGIGEHLYSPALGRFVRGLYIDDEGRAKVDHILDASLLILGVLDVWPPGDPRLGRTVEAVEQGLKVNTPVGGIARYTGDYYFRRSEDFQTVPGNPWFICTLWLALCQAKAARGGEELEGVRRILEWAAGRATPAGMLPEQLHPYTGEPLSVSPLSWSHATFVSAVETYLACRRKLQEGNRAAGGAPAEG
ncbi:MAG TPA: glycoside hydrolase family 15 [Peptococcaceae bacterium]|nr:MAG: Glycosyl hydrolase, glucoamylase [Moorella sp. 60_41]HBT47700.1 glycoside hydrolase family 15 [Peptococcaceae bacterium]